MPVMTEAHLSDIYGLIRLVMEQAEQMTDMVDELHSTIMLPFLASQPTVSKFTKDVNALVYGNIRASYRLLGDGMDAAFSRVMPLFNTPPSTPQREAMLAALNGIWGDTLEANANPLAIKMSLRQEGRALTLEKTALQTAIPDAHGRVILLIHGLCMNDLQWLRGGHDHGAALSRDLAASAVYLHYNSGLHISTNGRRLAALLEAFCQAWPQPVDELLIIGHSMGGLVARSACHYGESLGHSWRQKLRTLIFLGTPHHGAPLEQAGNWADALINASRYTAPFRRLGSNRSAGITDLRYGNLLDEDWADVDRFALSTDRRQIVPLPTDVACYAIAGSLGSEVNTVASRLIGDGLVPIDSALGIHNDSLRSLPFPPSHKWIDYRMGHLDLLSRADVFQKIKAFVPPDM
jgi:pimeloyl-ACP methyl ester carboxylesterase